MPSPLIPPRFQFPCATPGAAAAGFKLNTYAAGTATPLATYTNSTLSVANANPVIMGADGCADVWLGSLPYKLVGTDAANNVLWTEDNFSQAGLGVPQSEWVQFNGVPTFVSTTSFSIPGVADPTVQPYNLAFGSRVIITQSSGTATLYGTVSSIAANVITVKWDGGLVMTPAAQVAGWYGIIAGANSSIARRTYVAANDPVATTLSSGFNTLLNFIGATLQVDALGEFVTGFQGGFQAKGSGTYRVSGLIQLQAFAGTTGNASAVITYGPMQNSAFVATVPLSTVWMFPASTAATMLLPFDMTFGAGPLSIQEVQVAVNVTSFAGTAMTALIKSFTVQRVN